MHALLTILHAALPGPARRLISPSHVMLATQFVQFATVGLAGLLVDACVVYAARGRVGLYVAGLLSYLVAVTVTWALNRTWTFRGVGQGSALRQWARFVVANLLGFVLNRGAYFTLVTVSPLCAAQPIYAVAAGAIAGMSANFTLSRGVVFK
jgi:putative flippase GtrA